MGCLQPLTILPTNVIANVRTYVPQQNICICHRSVIHVLLHLAVVKVLVRDYVLLHCTVTCIFSECVSTLLLYLWTYIRTSYSRFVQLCTGKHFIVFLLCEKGTEGLEHTDFRTLEPTRTVPWRKQLLCCPH